MKRVLMPAGIVAIGVAVLILFVRTKPEPETKERSNIGALVEVILAKRADHDVLLAAQGTVMPARQIDLVPEVSGKVVGLHPDMVAGGRFKKGEAILSIDSRDYALGVEQQRAAVDRAALELELEKSRRTVAAREWQLLKGTGSGQGSEANPLALREPQVKSAQVALASATSALERAQLSLYRTTLRAPFDVLVQSESIDIGQQVGPQTRVAHLVGTEAYWVQVSVAVEMLGWMKLPTDGQPGTQARIWQKAGDQIIERTGRVIRLLGDVDPVGRMARLVVEVPDPLGREPGALPLLLGSYVNVELSGKRLQGVVSVPRRALRDGDRLYVSNAQGHLEVRELDVVWRRKDEVLVRAGIDDGELVIISRVATAVPGMKLRLEDDPRQDEAAVAAQDDDDGSEKAQ